MGNFPLKPFTRDPTITSWLSLMFHSSNSRVRRKRFATLVSIGYQVFCFMTLQLSSGQKEESLKRNDIFHGKYLTSMHRYWRVKCLQQLTRIARGTLKNSPILWIEKPLSITGMRSCFVNSSKVKAINCSITITVFGPFLHISQDCLLRAGFIVETVLKIMRATLVTGFTTIRPVGPWYLIGSTKVSTRPVVVTFFRKVTSRASLSNETEERDIVRSS